MLTKKQFAKKNATLNPVERAAAWRSYLTNNNVVHKGTATVEQRAEMAEKSRIGQARANRAKQRAESRLTNFESSVIEIDRVLVFAGFVLKNISECDSRYYERDGQHVRVSDHTANEATARWMESVACVEVTTVQQALEVVS